MHSLFWKIFLSFWGTLIVFTLLCVIVATVFINHKRDEILENNPREKFRGQLATLQQFADKNDLEGMKKWLREIDKREAVPLLVVDGNGTDILGRVVPRFVLHDNYHEHRRKEKPGKRWHDDDEQDNGHNRRGRRAQIVFADGRSFQLLPDVRAVTLGRLIQRPNLIALPFALAALLSGLVCFFLTRYLTAPLGHLSVASQQIAKGNLKYRVPTRIASRRDEIGVLANDFDQMAQRLDTLVAKQRQLIRDVSHELRSPLARLQAALGLARQRTGLTEQPELDRIELEAERLNTLIALLLSLARLDSGTSSLQVESVDLQALVRTVVADAKYEAQSHDCQVELVETCEGILDTDARLVHQALENIVRNAIKYTRQPARVEVSLSEQTSRDGYLITVRDFGPGVPNDMLSKMFEAFVRVDDARDRDSGGFGIGLAIAKRSIDALGGQVSAANHPHGGLIVSMLLTSTSRPAE